MSPILQDTPAYTHESYTRMQARWDIVRHVYGGTELMREHYKDYLWQSPAETGDEWEARSKQLECFPAFKQTVDGLTGIVFRVEPKLSSDVPQLIRDHCENIDGQGTHLTVFAKELFRDTMRDGHVGVIIDVPPVTTLEIEGSPPRRITRAEETVKGVRPFWIKIFADDILSWRVSFINGILTLTQLVVREVSEEPTGTFVSTYATRYRKYRREDDGTISWRVWTQEQVDSWTDQSYENPESSGVITNQREIPFVVVYAGVKLAPMVTKPGLMDLAYTNIIHMNVVSDRRNGLHTAMHPILVFKGRRTRPKDKKPSEDDQVLIGPGIGIDLPADPNANVFYAEHTGAALGEGRLEIQDIEKRMAALGLAMLQNDTRAAETAEAKRIDKDEKTANLSSAARSLQDGLELMLAFHANFMRLPSGGSLVVNRQFEVRPLDSGTISTLSAMVGNGQLSLETLWVIMAKYDLLPEDVDFEAELQRIVASGMTPGQGPSIPEPSVPKGNAADETGA